MVANGIDQDDFLTLRFNTSFVMVTHFFISNHLSIDIKNLEILILVVFDSE